MLSYIPSSACCCFCICWGYIVNIVEDLQNLVWIKMYSSYIILISIFYILAMLNFLFLVINIVKFVNFHKFYAKSQVFNLHLTSPHISHKKYWLLTNIASIRSYSCLIPHKLSVIFNQFKHSLNVSSNTWSCKTCVSNFSHAALICIYI